jgi:RecA-family ATPase
MNVTNSDLKVLHVACVAHSPSAHKWLVQNLWSHQAVGVIGGPPKCCKTWLGLDLAVSVASGTDCLGRFEVKQQGRVLIYLAEDALPMVKQRIEDICRHRNLNITELDLYVVDTPSLRLDLADHRHKLKETLARFQPSLLLLDPLVRLHRMDENSSADISRLLGFLRGLQRHFSLAVALVHHMAKRNNAQLGQALRGSGDIHAWADSSAYLLRAKNHLRLVIEHRTAAAPQPISLELVTSKDESAAHLEVIADEEIKNIDRSIPITEAVINALSDADRPMTRSALRSFLRVNNKRLGDALSALEQCSLVQRTSDGWQLSENESKSSDDRQLSLV